VPFPPIMTALNRPAGRTVVVLLGLLSLAAPAWLFADSLRYYRVQGDDFAYVGASRTFARAVDNLFMPHNAHIVPAWRLVTWGFVAFAGTIAKLPFVLGIATFAVVPMVMLTVGVLVGRETRRPTVGLVAMAFAGITSVLKSPATWYSAGQTLWAGLGILLTLLALQSWRRSGGWWRLALAAVFAIVAGGFWTIGHAAGIAGAAYLLADGRARARWAALVPLVATVVAVAVYFGLGAKRIEVEVRFEGKDSDKAMNPFRGASHTLQSVSETLVMGNLGVAAETSPLQAAILTLSIGGFWLWTFRKGCKPTPLECAGGVIVGVGYLISWTFRGYYTWVNLRGVVPWYDAIPHLGAVLFVAGWWSRVWDRESRPLPLSWGGAIGVVILTAALLAVHEPRATHLFIAELPKMTEAEALAFPVVELQRLRCVLYAEILQNWQREHFTRLDRAESIAAHHGIGLDLIHEAFGRVLTPGLPKKAYDAAELLNLPRTGSERDPNEARVRLAPLFVVTPEPPFPLGDAMNAGRR
jgi:hypothetical protein